MNIDFIRDNYRFNARASAVIYDKDLKKVLLFTVEGRDFYLLPGGRIEELEESIDTIKREIKEEIGWDNIDYSFLALSEEFVTEGHNNQQINIIYKGIYKDDIKETKFKGLEGDWCTFEWVDINNLNNYKIYPFGVEKIIEGTSNSNHLVNNLIKDNNK
ncbi:MAG: NUDIX domain-containing protein [Bacilli bacterium]|nr:NUDIX domain-containing protein [Bacilli bacterium]